eukprot:s281_g1.t1
MPRLPSPRCLDLPFTFSLSARIKSPEGVTLEQRQNAIECEGHLYAAIDFTPPQSVPDIGLDVTPRYYQPNEGSKGLTYNKIPGGWELADATDVVKEKVIKPYPWGTHLLVAKDSKVRLAGQTVRSNATRTCSKRCLDHIGVVAVGDDDDDFMMVMLLMMMVMMMMMLILVLMLIPMLRVMLLSMMLRIMMMMTVMVSSQ